MARIAGVNLPNQKRLEIGLTYIYGIGQPGRGPQLQPGMTLAIEPMITAGSPDVYLHDDEWSISTQDGSMAAHFEHTVAVTEEGPPRILTAAKAREKAGLVP